MSRKTKILNAEVYVQDEQLQARLFTQHMKARGFEQLACIKMLRCFLTACSNLCIDPLPLLVAAENSIKSDRNQLRKKQLAAKRSKT